MTEQELLKAYGIPARDDLLATLEDRANWNREQARRTDIEPLRRTIHLARAEGYEESLRIARGFLPEIIADAMDCDPEWEAKKALMDVAQYADSLR